MPNEGIPVPVVAKSRAYIIWIFVGIALLAGLIILGYLAYKSISDKNEQLRSEIIQFKQLTETLVRSSNNWTTKDDLRKSLANLLTPEDLRALERDIKAQGARLSAVGRTIGVISGRIAKLEESDSVGEENPNVEKCADGRLIDTHKYTQRPQNKRLKDSNDASVADVSFDASKKTPWNYEVFAKQFKLATIVSQRPSGQYIFHHNLKYSTTADGKKEYPIKITESTFQQTPLESMFYWINPKLDMNLFAGGKVLSFADGYGRKEKTLSLGVDLGLSLSSYGETKLDSWWRFFRFGAGYDAYRNAGRVSFSPAMFNIGKIIPLITNMYLTPQVAFDTGGGMIINLGIGPQL